MTVTTTANKSNQIGDNIVVTFYFTFEVNNAADIKVYLDDVLQSANYTLNLNADQDASPGGNVVMDTAPPLDAVLTILRDIVASQSTVYTEYDPFPAKSHEDALDKLTLLTQQNANDLDDGLKPPLTEDGTTDYTLPAYIAGKGLMYHETLKEISVSCDNINDRTIDAAASAAAE